VSLELEGQRVHRVPFDAPFPNELVCVEPKRSREILGRNAGLTARLEQHGDRAVTYEHSVPNPSDPIFSADGGGGSG